MSDLSDWILHNNIYGFDDKKRVTILNPATGKHIIVHKGDYSQKSNHIDEMVKESKSYEDFLERYWRYLNKGNEHILETVFKGDLERFKKRMEEGSITIKQTTESQKTADQQEEDDLNALSSEEEQQEFQKKEQNIFQKALGGVKTMLGGTKEENVVTSAPLTASAKKKKKKKAKKAEEEAATAAAAPVTTDTPVATDTPDTPVTSPPPPPSPPPQPSPPPSPIPTPPAVIIPPMGPDPNPAAPPVGPVPPVPPVVGTNNDKKEIVVTPDTIDSIKKGYKPKYHLFQLELLFSFDSFGNITWDDILQKTVLSSKEEDYSQFIDALIQKFPEMLVTSKKDGSKEEFLEIVQMSHKIMKIRTGNVTIPLASLQNFQNVLVNKSQANLQPNLSSQPSSQPSSQSVPRVSPLPIQMPINEARDIKFKKEFYTNKDDHGRDLGIENIKIKAPKYTKFFSVD